MIFNAETLVTVLGQLNTNMTTLKNVNWVWSDHGDVRRVSGKSFAKAGYVYAPYTPLVISPYRKHP